MGDPEALARATQRVALNADVVGYIRLLADDFSATAEIMDRYQHLVEDKVADSSGELISFVGDNFMAVFDDAMDALRASRSITKAIEDRNEDLPANRGVRFRMGIDQGTVVSSNDQWFGDALNIAARIQALAQPGGVSVSGPVYKALDEPALRFRSTGFRELKNIPEPVEVFEFAELPSVGPPPAGTSLSLDPPTVAVLPTHASSLSPEMHSAGELIRSDLIHRLSTIPGLKLIDAAENSQVAPLASPQYILETGMHQVTDQVRLYFQLIEMATMNVIASHKWRLTPDEAVDMSEEVSEDVAFSIEVELVIGEPARDYAELHDPVATQKIYQGWYHLTSMTPEGLSRALDLFGDVADSHPEHPFGAALSSFALWMGASEGMLPNPDRQLERAHVLAQQATKMGDRTDLAHIVEAAITLQRGGAEEALRMVEAVEMTRPTCDVTFALAGSIRRYIGQWEASVDLLDRAMRLTATNKPWYPTVKACALYMGNSNEAAAAIAESVLEHQPRNLEALLVLAAAQEEQGLERRARATAEMIRERFPSVQVYAWLDQRPFQDKVFVGRWKDALQKSGIDETT